MSLTFGKATLTHGEIIRETGMRGVSTMNTTETVVYTSNLSTANVERVVINLTARNISTSMTYAKVRRNAGDGEILLEGYVSGSTEGRIGTGIFSKGTGVFVWTLWVNGNTGYIGGRSGIIGGPMLIGIVTSPIVLPIKLSLTSLKAASLISPVTINGFSFFGAPIIYTMPAPNTFFNNLTIVVNTVYATEDYIALSLEGWILTVS